MAGNAKGVSAAVCWSHQPQRAKAVPDWVRTLLEDVKAAKPSLAMTTALVRGLHATHSPGETIEFQLKGSRLAAHPHQSAFIMPCISFK